MKRNKFNSGFIPVFTGIKPTANMTLPTYLRQIQYLEGVLNRLIEEIENNFDSFNTYTVDKLQKIEDEIAQSIANVTTDVVTDEVIRVVAEEIDNIIASIEEFTSNLALVDLSIEENRVGVEQVVESVEVLDAYAKALSATVGANKLEAKEYSDTQHQLALDYTDTKVAEIDLVVDDAHILNLINQEVSEIAYDVGINTIDISGMGGMISEAIGEIAAFDEKVELAITDLEDVKVDVGTLLSKDTDLTVMTNDVEGLKTDMNTAKEGIFANTTTVSALSTTVEAHTGDIDGLGSRVSALETVAPEDTDNTVLAAKVSTLEDGQASIISDVSDLKVAQTKYVSDNVEPRLKDVELSLAIDNQPYNTAAIRFKGSKYNVNNLAFNLGKANNGANTYKGRLAYQYDELVDFSLFETEPDEDYNYPMNIASPLTGKSIVPQCALVHYDGQYKDELGELVEFQGFDMRAKYGVGTLGEVGYDKITIKSNKLEEVYNELSLKTITEFKLDVFIDVELVFDGIFAVI